MFGHDRYRPGDELVDIADVGAFFLIAERNRHPLVACPAGAPDAVYVGLRDIRDFVVDDVRKFFHINAPGGDIRGDQDAGLARLEIVQGALPGILRFIAVDRFRSDTGPVQIFDQAVGPVFSAGEYEGGRDIHFEQQVDQQGLFLVFRHIVERLVDALRGRRGRRNGYALRVAEDIAR